VTNVTLEENGPDSALVRSKFMMIEFRRNEQRLFGGTCLHRLVHRDGGIRIRLKRIDLVNCDAPLDGIVVPF
jgi:3-phenylpropionate/cinnamic acid dioxygenase small subunit